MIQSISYTEPVLCHSNYDLKRAWYVYFRITNELTGETIPKQFRGGINYWPDKRNRLHAGNSLVKTWKTKLENGWHPFKEIEKPLINSSTPFDEALDFALSNCIISSATKKAYRSTIKFVKEAAKALGLLRVPVAKIETPHIMLILNKIKNSRDWENTAYNKHKGYLCAIMARIKEWRAIKYNPAEDIKQLPTVETKKYIPYTEAEKQLITDYLYVHHYRFFVYLMVIYHTGMRPKEVLSLRIKDLNQKEATITILPDLKAENSKTKKIRKVPINPHLLRYFRELELDSYPAEYYVFGSPFGPGGNRGSMPYYGEPQKKTGMRTGVSGVMRPDYFLPSPNRIKRDTVTRLWQKIVMKKLSINKYQYAMKHTGADDKILAGISIDALKELYGHSSKYMTETYTTKIKEIYRQDIIEKSPGFIALK